MVFNSRVVPVFILWLPKISGSSIGTLKITHITVQMSIQVNLAMELHICNVYIQYAIYYYLLYIVHKYVHLVAIHPQQSIPYNVAYYAEY